jgi:putative membrane protein
MWIFPLIGCSIMIILCIMMFIFSNRFGGSCFHFPNHYNGNTKNTNKQESALEILDRRYANGDISKEEYEQIKKDILT